MSSIQWTLITSDLLALTWPSNNLLNMEIEGLNFTLGKWQDHYYAFASKCPHASGKMNEGYINPLGQVVCPLHKYCFDMANGRNSSGEGYFLKTYPVELRENGLFIGIKPNYLV